MDWNGAFFSLMALVAQNTFDILGGVLYIICCVLEMGIFTSHIIWLLRTRQIRREAATQGKTFDDIAAEHEMSGMPFKFAERKSRKERQRLAKEKEDLEASIGVGMRNLGPTGERATANTPITGETPSVNMPTVGGLK
ncbi:hypothetical protein N0V82_006994 [Gnomoniopsis sp. IMI 355080]|nr:hypothetical protein N0V82_006994 [Gnomoniopsis sp. IMI 355080]